MCLTVMSPLKTAETDLYVVKKVKKLSEGEYRAFYRTSFIYKIGDVKKARMDLRKKLYSHVYMGIHAIIYDSTWCNGYLVSSNDSSNALLICKIPKGSKYYIGKRGDIVTNCLEIIEEINVVLPHTSILKMSTGVKRAFKYIEEKYGKQTY